MLDARGDRLHVIRLPAAAAVGVAVAPAEVAHGHATTDVRRVAALREQLRDVEAVVALVTGRAAVHTQRQQTWMRLNIMAQNVSEMLGAGDTADLCHMRA